MGIKKINTHGFLNIQFQVHMTSSITHLEICLLLLGIVLEIRTQILVQLFAQHLEQYYNILVNSHCQELIIPVGSKGHLVIFMKVMDRYYVVGPQ
jgi:hypothetical protein